MIVSQRATDFADQDFDVVRVHVSVGPDGLEQGVTRHDTARAVDQAPEHGKSLVRQADTRLALPEGFRGGIEPERVEMLHRS